MPHRTTAVMCSDWAQSIQLQPFNYVKASDLIENGVFDISDIESGNRSAIDIAIDIAAATMIRQVEVIVRDHRPEVIHVLTHAGLKAQYAQYESNSKTPCQLMRMPLWPPKHSNGMLMHVNNLNNLILTILSSFAFTN